MEAHKSKHQIYTAHIDHKKQFPNEIWNANILA